MSKVLVGLVLGTILDALAGAEAAPAVTGKAAFERLKSFAGGWESNEPGLKVVYKTTGAGSALVETPLPGSDHEMVSVYHLDGEDLVNSLRTSGGVFVAVGRFSW